MFLPMESVIDALKDAVLGPLPTREQHNAVLDENDRLHLTVGHLLQCLGVVEDARDDAVDVAWSHGWRPPFDPEEEPHLRSCEWATDLAELSVEEACSQLGNGTWEMPGITFERSAESDAHRRRMLSMSAAVRKLVAIADRPQSSDRGQNRPDLIAQLLSEHRC
jgi:hypothetical protein